MDFGLSDEQRQLKESAREFLTKECPTAYVRKTMADESGAVSELSAHIAKLGWNGLIVPEKFGGAGLTMLDMAVLLEELGYAAAPGPFLFSSALAARALVLGGSDELNKRLLVPLAEGKLTGTMAKGSFQASDMTAARDPGSSGWVLNGSKAFVPFGQMADFIIVGARTSSAPLAVELFVIEAGAKGVTTKPLKHLDVTRRVSTLQLESVAVAPGAVLKSGILEKVLDSGAVAIAADSLGGTERALEMAVEYSKVREQFGKPIGSFQALKHAAAEIVADLEPARALLWYAAYALDALPDAAPRAASMAKARLCEVYSRAADRSVLMHGGIGFTWEHDIHFWFKRSRFNESFMGSPAEHRERVAELGGY